MKASTGIILTIYEGQLDTKLCEINKINVFVSIKHGLEQLETKIWSGYDKFPRWNQIFHLEKQGEVIELAIFHKPLLMKEIEIGSCNLSTFNQNGWVHILKEKIKVGSLKIKISNEFLSSNSNETHEIYHQKFQEIQKLKNEALLYKNMYKKEKKLSGNCNSSNKIHELAHSLKLEQENYKKLEKFVNEKKNYVREQEEYILKEKEKVLNAKQILIEDHKEIRELTYQLQKDFAEIQQAKNKISVHARIIKNSHRNSKSEGRNPEYFDSPLSKNKKNLCIPNSQPNFNFNA
jgi:hypothetical protein